MEAVKRARCLLEEKIRTLLEEVKGEENREITDEIKLELSGGLDDVMRMIEKGERTKELKIQISAGFVDIPVNKERYSRAVAVNIEMSKTARGKMGYYKVSWGKNHKYNIKGECMTGVVTPENTALSGILAAMIAAKNMKQKGLVIWVEDPTVRQVIKNPMQTAQKSERVSKVLLGDIMKLRGKEDLKLKIMTDENRESVEALTNVKIKQWWT